MMPDCGSGRRLRGRATVEGAASGPALALGEQLSLWGGLDATTGEIIDSHHPHAGQRLTGAVVVMAHGRGSSSASSVLVEAIRLGTAPAGFVLSEPDEIIALGCLVGAELYQVVTPLLVVTPADLASIATGEHVVIDGAVLSIR